MRGLSSKVIAAVIVVIILAVAAGAFILGFKPGGVETYQLRILTGSTAGTYYPVGSVYAKLLNQYSEGMIDARALEGKASVGNIKDLCWQRRGGPCSERYILLCIPWNHY